MDEHDPLPGPGYQPPGYQPSPGLRTRTLDSWRDLETVPEPARGRGSLPGLVVVVGLIVFFVADAITGGPDAKPGGPTQPPGGETPPAAAVPLEPLVLVAAGALLLFLLAATVEWIIRRTRRSAPNRTVAVENQTVRLPLHRLLSARSKPHYVRLSAEPEPGATRSFLRAVDQLLAAVDRLPDRQAEGIEDDLRRFAESGAEVDLAQVVELLDSPEILHFLMFVGRLSESQKRYLYVVIEARRELR